MFHKFHYTYSVTVKIIIKGDRNVGKSCLLERLQGRGFIEAYTPSEAINVASIQWSFKATEDVVKVEVWDVVDRGKARARPTGLKLSLGANAIPEEPALDAEFLDVFKGTHGVILMMDITKNWTLEYASKELPKIPPEIPVLLLGNHCDMAHHRVITEEEAIGLIEGLGPRAAKVLYGESSMRNGFGLRLLHKFLSLPFLQLQRETLTALLARNKRDTEVCSLEMTEFLVIYLLNWVFFFIELKVPPNFFFETKYFRNFISEKLLACSNRRILNKNKPLFSFLRNILFFKKNFRKFLGEAKLNACFSCFKNFRVHLMPITINF